MSAVRLFPYARWYAELPALQRQYASQQPFPHVHLSDFLDAPVIEHLIDEFPTTLDGPWIHYKHYNNNTLGMTARAAFPPFVGRLMDELNSDAFVAWLRDLTGIRELVADPSLEGSGMHSCGAGGFLNVHADFTMHHHRTNWRRRVNVIVYLNRTWQPEWGGALELWDRGIQRPLVRVPPIANHAVIFNTDEDSYHGFPDPITCPPGVTRKSLALYYYSPESGARAAAKSTNYRPRPGDGRRVAAFIWADKQLVGLYSRVKSAFGLSDDVASRTLGFLGRRKRRRP
jgi:hypothetical protein